MACGIKNCPYKRGETVFCVPAVGPNRSKWIYMIKQHQEFEESKMFLVCLRHFSPNDLHMTGTIYKLTPNAIPMIFPSRNDEWPRNFRTPYKRKRKATKIIEQTVPKPKTNKVDMISNVDTTVTESFNAIRSDPYNFDKNFIDVDNIKIEPVGQNSSSLMRDDVDLNEAIMPQKIQICDSCRQYDIELQTANQRIRDLEAEIIEIQADKEQLQKQLLLANDSSHENETDQDAGQETNKIKVESITCNVTPSEMTQYLFVEQEIIECPQCAMTFISIDSFVTHLSSSDHQIWQKMNNDTKSLYKCGKCHLVYSTLTLMECHEKTHNIFMNMNNETISKFFKCGKCDEAFEKAKDLEVHIRTLHCEETFECYLCKSKIKDRFETLDHLRSHVENRSDNGKDGTQSARKSFVCNICSRTFAKCAHLNSHLKIHESKKYHGNKCGEDFRSIESSGKHKSSEIHLSELEKMFKCGKCGASFKTSAEMSHHMRNFHTEKRIYECYICKKRLAVERSLRNHMRNHFNYEQCAICKEPLDEREVNTHLCGDVKSIRCEYCDETFTATTKLLIHLESSHEQKKLYKCDKCTKFLPMVFLKNHHQHIDIPKPFMCNACPKTFATNTLLKAHEKIHGANRDHLCDECGMSFLTANNLQTHKRYSSIHNEPTFQCPDCPSKFYNESKLKRHRDNHQGIIHVCEICKSEHRSKLGYNSHMKIHNRTEADRRFHCEICPKKFFDWKNLKKHYTVHSGEKRFFCRFCDAAYKHHGDLNKHMRSHVVDGKIHECDKCPLSFYYPGELQEHLAEHFKEEKAKLARREEENNQDND